MQVGNINTLRVTEQLPFGWYLENEDGELALLPDTDDADVSIGQTLDVFVYYDKDDRLAATTKQPLIMVGQTGVLTARNVTDAGAFMDWGLDKDLFVPVRNMHKPMSPGLTYVVHVYLDAYSGRPIATSRLRDYLKEKNGPFSPRQEVELLIFDKTDMGYKAVINDTHLGLVFRDEVFHPLAIGDRLPGFIKDIREDRKINLCFQFHDQRARGDLAQQILDDLEAHGGISTLTDKSSPEEINQRFGVSKGAYKKALGALYKQQKITLDKTRILLNKP